MGNSARETVPVFRVISEEVDVDGKPGVTGSIEGVTQVKLSDVPYHLAALIIAIYDAAADIQKASGFPMKEALRNAIISMKIAQKGHDTSTMTLVREDGEKESFDFTIDD
jgi:hypothetical protein